MSLRSHVCASCGQTLPEEPDQLAALMCRWKTKGAPEDFAQVIEEIAPRLSDRFWRRFPKCEPRPDLINDTIYKMLKGTRDFKCGQPLWPWVRQIFDNTVIDDHRKSRRRVFSGATPVDQRGRSRSPNPFDELADRRAVAPDQQLIQIENIDRMYAEIAKLANSMREIVTLFLTGMAYHEIAHALNCPKGTIASTLSRAKEILRRRLQEE